MRRRQNRNKLDRKLCQWSGEMNNAVDNTTRKGRQEAGSPDTQVKKLRMATSMLWSSPVGYSLAMGRPGPLVHWLAEHSGSVEAEAGQWPEAISLPRQ